ncbi:hypothetical protein ACHAWX_001646 [Stephanocyclus meneghinianus]
MGPLHALRSTCELVSGRLQDNKSDDVHERERSCVLLERAVDTVTLTTRMVADVSDLARFDAGATLEPAFKLTDLRDLGLQAIESIKFQDLRLKGGDDGITVSLKLIGQRGPAAIHIDRAVLLRVLAHLLENSVREVSPGGNVTLQITSSINSSEKGVVLFEVIDNGKGLPPGTCLDNRGDSNNTTSPASRHRYVIGRSSCNDPDEMEKARAEMEEGLRSLKQNGVGVGLPLSYHLVCIIGGDLRYEKLSVGSKIYFTLQGKHAKITAIDNSDVLKTETILKSKIPLTEISFVPKEHSTNKRQRVDDFDFENFVSCDTSLTTSRDSDTLSSGPATVAVAKCGVKAELPFSVLIVEDTDICARVLGMQLKKLKCSTQRAENGQVAIDILKDSMPGTFDMVLMDLRMPVMDGLTATKIIRDELKIDLPILALTGERRDDIQSECEGVGFTEFYQKPLPKKILEDLISKYKAIRDGTIRPVGCS